MNNKIRIPVTITVDLEGWAVEWGLDADLMGKSALRKDARDYVEGLLWDALESTPSVNTHMVYQVGD